MRIVAICGSLQARSGNLVLLRAAAALLAVACGGRTGLFDPADDQPGGTSNGPGADVDGGAASSSATSTSTNAGRDSGSEDEAGLTNPGSDSGSDGGPDAAQCSPGAQQCASATAVQICGSGGQWGAPWTCATGACLPVSGGGTAGPAIAGACVGTTTTATSCSATGLGLDDCGTGNASCCTSEEVTGGTYWRTYTNDGVTVSGEMDPASVNGFRLDKYPVTVGRFRQFVYYLLKGPGALPVNGSGIHAYLNGGKGLANSASPGSFEAGWDGEDWNGNFPDTTSAWHLDLTTCGSLSSWTMTAGSQESLPLNCVSWYEAYAFCIWDGGFLPSEAEWEFVAAGGNQQREYPWGSTDPGTANQYAIYGCYYPSGASNCSQGNGVENMAPVDSAALGVSLWGQLHMEGDVANWNLDWSATYANPCTDCAYLNSAVGREFRGSDFTNPASSLTPPIRNEGAPAAHDIGVGLRCARAP